MGKSISSPRSSSGSVDEVFVFGFAFAGAIVAYIKTYLVVAAKFVSLTTFNFHRMPIGRRKVDVIQLPALTTTGAIADVHIKGHRITTDIAAEKM